MAWRWRVRPVEAQEAIENGTAHEPFAYDPVNDMVYTKEHYDTADEPRDIHGFSDTANG